MSKAALIDAFYMFGFLFGSLLIGMLSDRFGRKKALFLSVIGASVFTFVGAFITQYWAYLSLRYVFMFTVTYVLFVVYVFREQILVAQVK